MEKTLNLLSVLKDFNIQKINDDVYEITDLNDSYINAKYNIKTKKLNFYYDVRGDEIYNQEVSLDVVVIDNIRELIKLIENNSL